MWKLALSRDSFPRKQRRGEKTLIESEEEVLWSATSVCVWN